MLGWIKDKVADKVGAAERAALVADLTKHFSPLEFPKLGAPDLSERLARYVAEGDDSRVLQDLKANRTNHHFNYSVRNGLPSDKARHFNAIVKALAPDTGRMVRLAMAHHAAYGRNHSYGFAPVPAFAGRCEWLVALLEYASRAGGKNEKNLSAQVVEAIVADQGADASILVAGAFLVQDAKGKWRPESWNLPPHAHFRSLDGFSGLVSRYPDIVRQALAQSNSMARAHALTALHALEVPVAPFVEEIAALAVSGSKEVREAAEPILKAHFAAIRPLIEAKAAKASSDERFHSVRLLARLGGAEARAFLAERLEAEKPGKVADALRDLLADAKPREAGEADAPEDFGLQPVPDIPSHAPLDRKVLEDLRACMDEFERRAAEEFANNEWAKKQKRTRTPVAKDAAERFYNELQDFQVTADKGWLPFDYSYAWKSFKVVQNFAAHPSFELIHLVRWCLLLAGRQKNPTTGTWQRWDINYGWSPKIQDYQHSRKRPIDLRQLAAAFRAIGLNENLIGYSILRQNSYAPSPFLLSDPDAIWPYFAERPHLIEECLGMKPIGESDSGSFFSDRDLRPNAFAMLKLFPHIPARFLPVLWEIALGASKTERPLARQCLATMPGKEEKIVAAVASKQQDTRLAAVEWLTELKYKPAIPALRAALEKEKSEIVRDELIRTLEALGVSVAELLDVDRLDQDAENGLKKGIPAELEWFPFARLPAVRWADSGKPVSPKIVEWFLVQGCRLKDAEASPSLRRYCSLFRKDDAETLGRFVLEAWIGKDTKPKYTSDQASALAQQEAASAASIAQRYPQYYTDFDEQRTYQAAFNRFLVQPEGSQNGTKGILAVSGACCGGDVAPIVHRYVKQWFGYRGAQCKALLQVLAWIDSPSAIQVVLAVANRFRTKGIQEEAMRLCQMLADRKGWTLDELADRTIPTCGLDEQGAMELDYGARAFTVRLTAEMALELSNQKGKVIASLPDPNQSDDAEKAKAAKATLSTARKELKTVLAMQKDRLYEALCTQRAWRFEDWDTYLRPHPIVGRYCQRLVWSVCEGEKSIASFRPMADGSLTDFQDDTVTVDANAAVRLAHQQTLPPGAPEQWVQHFADYNVEPLFQQFGKQTFELADARKNETEIAQFRGHVLKAFSLRNRLTRLGYTRGESQDGGWFFEYKKGFAGLGIDAMIEFTGNGVPEENRTVALERLYFARRVSGQGYRQQREIPLSELPVVLLTECWNDIRMAAADGSGFAEDWRKQVEF
jgi:hypothetical protein